MVSETPPHRPKPDTEPVTIDLTAEEIPAVAEPIRSNDSDGPTPAETEAAPKEADDAEAGIAADDDAAQAQVEESTQEPAPQPVTTRPRPSIPALIAAGLFGGVAALALAGSIYYAGYLPLAAPASIQAPAPQAAPPVPAGEIAALRSEIAALRNRPAPPADTALAERVAAIEAAATTGPDDSALETLRGELAALRSETATLRGETDQLRAEAETLRGQTGVLRDTLESAAGMDGELARRLDQAEAKLNAPGPEQDVARAVAAAGLKAAIDRGGNFETELRTFATVAGDDPAVAELQKFAAAGIPSRAALAQEFPAAANAMLTAMEKPAPADDIATRLLSSALSVVKVRRVGEVEGESPEAVIARLEQALLSGDLALAAREWQALPEPARAASAAFKQNLDARVAVENLVDGTLKRAVESTGG